MGTVQRKGGAGTGTLCPVPWRVSGRYRSHGVIIVESANKLVVEARLKGAGMSTPCRSGERANVNLMVAMRACVCSDAWQHGWEQITTERRRAGRERRAIRHAHHRAAKAPPAEGKSQPGKLGQDEAAPREQHDGKPAPEKMVVDGRPTANHPWKRRFLPPRVEPGASCKTLGAIDSDAALCYGEATSE